MRKWKNAIAILGICLFVGSMSSCKAIKKAKSKRCKCPSWSMEDQSQDIQKVKSEEVASFEEVTAD